MSIERGQRADATLRSIAAMLKTEPENLALSVQRQLDRSKALEQEVASLRRAQLDGMAAELAGEAINSVVVTQRDGFGGDDLRGLVQSLRNRGVAVAVVVGNSGDGKVALAVATDGSLDAGAMCKELAQLVGGGGGGAKELAVAGGRDVGGIPALLQRARELAGA
ncbi:MAG: DHHA1 domain-containing protein [Actinomycetota bacterium]